VELSPNVCARGLRVDDVARYVGISKSHVWFLAKNDPTFPRPRRRGARMTIWLREEVDQWLDRAAEPAAVEA
jgi:predicted DNA-binding transcriptional regulator AlpA